MDDNSTPNPFAALFGSPDQAKAFSDKTISSEQPTQSSDESKSSPIVADDDEDDDVTTQVNRLGEIVFRISLNPDIASRCEKRATYFSELAEVYDSTTTIDQENVRHIVFEVIMLDRHAHDFMVIHSLDHEKNRLENIEELEETEVLTYLYQCYGRCLRQQERQQDSDSRQSLFLKECMDVAISNARMCLQQPDLYQYQDFASQFIELCLQENRKHSDPQNLPCQFLREVANDIECNSDQGTLSQSLKVVLEEVRLRLTAEDMSIIHKDAVRYVQVLHFFTGSSALARTFLSLNTPEPSSNLHGRVYEMTPLGAALSLSILPRSENEPFQFFSKPSNQTKREVDMVENSVWQATEELVSGIHKIFHDLMVVSPEMKHYTLRWLGLCIHGNSGRGQIWANNLPSNLFVSDAFSVNFTSVLLLLCRPFCNPDSWKLMKIQPSYTIATANGNNEMMRRSVHLLKMSSETCLIPCENMEKVEEDEVFTFITECFFITHKAIQVFFQPVVNRLISVNRDLYQIQRLYNDAVQQSQGNPDAVGEIKTRMEKAMMIYLNRKAAVTQPSLLANALKLHIASSSWVCRVGTSKLPKQTELDGNFKLPDVPFPLPESPEPVLTCIPEFVLNNICNTVIHIHRFDDSVLEKEDSGLEFLMNLVLVFMGSPKRMKNPHLRAELAEMLASLMPVIAEDLPDDKMPGPQHNREKLFEHHPKVTYLPETLIHVFVSIEMTGEGVAFEQKFNYRRPMYNILKYIWNIPVHREKIKELAEYAEDNILCSDPPLFLRFINLLVNDATFLLDEALMFMGQIKEKQKERDQGQWSRLPESQRHQEESNLQQISRMAQYHNVMSRDTINTLRMLTSYSQSIFCHATFVDRMASMLNYFLCRLVGPRQKEFSVKDKQNYDFKPQETVSTITAIYLNLQKSERFCEAVFQDERSYTSELFSQTCNVLEKIGESPQTIYDFMALEERLKEMKEMKQSQEEALAEAPDEFLDPIMGTLMSDPVMLPDSKNIVDRTVIARHILSDQTDPFNRQPLSLDMVIPQTELKARIEAWRAEKIKNS